VISLQLLANSCFAELDVECFCYKTLQVVHVFYNSHTNKFRVELSLLHILVLSDIHNTGSTKHNIRKHIAIARNCCMSFLGRNIWHSSISLATKLWLYRVIVLPVILCGAETWSPTRQLLRNIDAFEKCCLHRILRISWTDCISNEEVHRCTDQPPLTHIIRTTRLKFCGHITLADPSMDQSRALRSSVALLPRDWNHRSGQPHQTWLCTVKSDVAPLNIGLATAYHRAQNWQAWREVTRGNSNVHWTSHMMMMSSLHTLIHCLTILMFVLRQNYVCPISSIILLSGSFSHLLTFLLVRTYKYWFHSFCICVYFVGILSFACRHLEYILFRWITHLFFFCAFVYYFIINLLSDCRWSYLVLPPPIVAITLNQV